jgi:hypothetical protein
MKIQKFNESAQNWTENKIAKMYDEHSEFDKLVRDYLYINHKDLFEDEKNLYRLNQFWFEPDSDEYNKLTVFYSHNGYKRKEYINYEFSDEEFDDLLKYMNNPEMYKDSKKYNL